MPRRGSSTQPGVLTPGIIHPSETRPERAPRNRGVFVPEQIDLAPLQGAVRWGRFQGLKPLAESWCPFGASPFKFPIL
jgi:hypothetical protein